MYLFPFPLLEFSPPLESCSDIYTGPTSCLIVTLLFNVLFLWYFPFYFFICHLSLSVVDLLISVLYTQIERSLLSISTRHAPLLLVGCKCVLGLGQALRQKRFSKIASCTFKGAAVRAATRGNPDWSSVYRCRLSRDSEGDGSGHYESGGVMSPPSPVPSAPLSNGVVERRLAASADLTQAARHMQTHASLHHPHRKTADSSHRKCSEDRTQQEAHEQVGGSRALLIALILFLRGKIEGDDEWFGEIIGIDISVASKQRFVSEKLKTKREETTKPHNQHL